MIKEENLYVGEETSSLSGLSHQSRKNHRSRSNNSSILSLSRTLTSSSSDGCPSRSQSPEHHLPLDSADEIDIGL